MPDYNQQFFDHLSAIFQLLTDKVFYKFALILFLPTYLIYTLNNGYLFVIYFSVCCVFMRHAKLGGVIGFFIVTLTIFFYYISPELGHFIENIIRAPARANSTIITSLQVFNHVPETTPSKILWSLFYGIRVGLLVGLGLGFVGKKIWGIHPKMENR